MADTHYNLTHQNGNVAHVEKATWRQTQRPSLYLLWAPRQTLHQFGQQQSILSLFLPLALSICLRSLNFEKTRLHMTMQLKFPSITYIPDISDYSIQPVARRHVSLSQSDGWLHIARNRAMVTFFFFFALSPFICKVEQGFPLSLALLLLISMHRTRLWTPTSSISHANTLLLILIYLNMDHTAPFHITEQNKEENKMQIT